MSDRVSSRSFYATFHGHATEYLHVVLEKLREKHDSVVFLAGDSSLDNKFWLSESGEACNGYEEVLVGPEMKCDVCYWMNREAQNRREAGEVEGSVGVLNTAIEATSLNDRSWGWLLDQDVFIRDHIKENDVLVVSVGGNDIALTPLLMTILNIAALVCCTPQTVLEHTACACTPNIGVDTGCSGCGLPGCIVGTCTGWPLGFGYFVDLFKNRVENYINRLVAKQKPKTVVVCMIYFLDEKETGSWADPALGCMCYNCSPGRLQCAIRKVFEHATSKISIPGVNVVPFPLFETLDGKDTNDYIERVEPSVQGGRKMATALMDAILKHPS